MIDWSGKLAARDAPDEKAKEIIGGIYQAGLDSLASELKQYARRARRLRAVQGCASIER